MSSMPTTFNKKRKRLSFDCIICLNSFEKYSYYGTDLCDHSLCYDCIRTYFNSTLKDSRYSSYDFIQCPSTDCQVYFATEDEVLSRFFNKAEIEQWWDSALSSKAYIQNKIQCPMSDCQAVFGVDDVCTQQCTFIECVECHRGLCVTCQSPWHPGEIKIVNDKEALKLTLSKAKKSKWCRCPKCNQVIEKDGGCRHIRCLCGAYFCYYCGRYYTDCIDECVYWSDGELTEYREFMFEYKEDDI